jgi:putative copper export protein
MKKALTIFIGFLHDFAAGCWAATVLAVYWVDRISSGRPELKPLFDTLEQRFFWAGVACTAVVLTAGTGRTFTYVDNVYGPEAEQSRRRMLIIKHLLLVAVFGLGTWWQYTLAYVR